MKKFVFHVHRTLIYVIIAAFILLSAGVLVIGTPWIKQIAKTQIIELAKKKGFEISIKKIESPSPLYYKLSDVAFQIANDKKITAESVNFKISIFALFRKRITFKSFLVKNVNIIKTQTTLLKQSTTSQKEVSFPKIPYSISFKSAKIQGFNYYFEKYKKEISFDISGKAKLKKSGNISLDLTINRQDFPHSKVHIISSRLINNKLISSTIFLNFDTITSLYPFIDSNIDGQLKALVHVNGTDSSYINLFSNKTNEPLFGDISGSIKQIKSSLVPLRDEKINFSSKFSFNNKGKFLSISDLLLKSALLDLDGHLTLNRDLIATKGEVFLSTKEKLFSSIHKSFPITTKIKARATFSQDKKLSQFTKIDYKLIDFSINDSPIKNAHGSIDAYYKSNKFHGQIISSLSLINTSKIDFISDFSISRKKIELKKFSLASNYSKIDGNISFRKKSIIGYINYDISSPYEISYFIPHITIKGEIKGKSTFHKDENDKQVIKNTISLMDFRKDNFKAKKIDATIYIDDIFTSPSFRIGVYPTMCYYDNLLINDFYLKTTYQTKNNFECYLKGHLNGAVDLNMEGSWEKENSTFTLELDKFYGHLINEDFSSQSPIKLHFDKKHFLMKNVDLKMSRSNLLANIEINKNRADITIKAKSFPIDLLSINPYDLNISGYLDADINLQKKLETSAVIDVDVNNIKITSTLDQKPIFGNININLKMDNNDLFGKAKLTVNKNQVLQANGNVPVLLHFHPFSLKINQQDKIQAKCEMKGKIEDLLDFLDIGSHKIEGDINSKIEISKTFADPKIEGYCDIDNGSYLNYYTGTNFTNIKAVFTTDSNDIILKSLKADGKTGGTLLADGHFDINPMKKFPFQLKAKFIDLVCMDTDIAHAIGHGELDIIGNSEKATAKGYLKINEADLSIPKKLPVKIPELDIKFINDKRQKEEILIKHRDLYPVELDITISSTDNIYIEGRGLSSQWKGNFNITGTTENIIPKGKLELIKGDYVFSGRFFDLTQGSVIFSGKSGIMPSLSVKAKTTQGGVGIMASLKGPLDEPILSFSSSPPLALSSIMSLLLFGQDISEITPIQAAQLAAIIASVSEGPDILDKTRKNLGIDRFSIISTPAKNINESDKMALQVGKYITRGVMVSLSQGMEQGSSNIIVEIDLKHGFIFQVETQQEQEQGKFTLKWNLNY
jgi:hypothetical protein